MTAPKPGEIFYFPAPTSFKDTGYVQHSYSDGSIVRAKVVPANDNDPVGFLINFELIDGDGETLTDVTFDRHAALCICDVLLKNMLNQEDLYYEAIQHGRVDKTSPTVGEGEGNQ